MQIQFFCPRWGSETIPWEKWLPQVKDAGYDGVEWAIDRKVTGHGIEQVLALGEKHQLQFIAQHYDTTIPDHHLHVLYYADWLHKVSRSPFVRINSQTGLDYYSFEQNSILLDLAADSNVIHETHRGKFSFSAHITHQYLQRLPNLRLTLDASHWVNVSESFLENQQSAMQLAIERTDHIHARIGYPEGPQVSDPRAEEWQHALEKHLRWWDAVVQLKRQHHQNLTITPEFGPFPYMVHDPLSKQPLANQWDVNLYMMQLLRNRYAKNLAPA
jgi:sugar phosphate isomerase/epimerase